MRPLAVDVCRTIDQIRLQMRTLHQVFFFDVFFVLLFFSLLNELAFLFIQICNTSRRSNNGGSLSDDSSDGADSPSGASNSLSSANRSVAPPTAGTSGTPSAQPSSSNTALRHLEISASDLDVFRRRPTFITELLHLDAVLADFELACAVLFEERTPMTALHFRVFYL